MKCLKTPQKQQFWRRTNYEYEKGKKKLVRQFVGVTTNVGTREVEVKFFCPVDNSKSVFMFPHIPDEGTITTDQTARLLEASKQQRGKFVFEDDVLP